MASDIFKKLLQKEWISSMIAACLQDSLFRALPCRSPHQEALSVFLLLPECLVMHHARKWRDLAVLFAEAVCKMSKQSLRVLKKCWASLEASSLSTLVQMLKTAFICEQHFSASPLERHRKFKALLETMREVHEVNKINSLLPESTFYIKELSCNFDFFAEGQRLALRDKNMVPEETASVIFSDFPFIFNLLSKIKLLQAYSRAKMWYSKDQTILPGDNQSNTLTLRVGRGSLVADALRQLSQVEDIDLSKVLVVEFIKEIRPESGGVTSEFFHCMFEKLTNPEYGMFMYPEEGSYMWFPANPKFEKKSYFLFGLLCGLSLFNFNLANLSFPLVLYKKLLEQKPSLEDLKELSPLLGRNLQELLNYEDGDIEELSIYFSINWDQNEVDLIPDGISKPVNQSNKKDYISKYVDYIFNVSVKETYEEFHRGFYKVCNWNIIRLFQPEELMKAIIGNTDYDWKQFENNSVYCGEYHKSHPTILMFWKAFYKLTLDEKKKFLLFLTGCDRLPIKGLHNKGIVFRCPEDLSEKDHPRSVTCHNILDLPKYSTMKRMKEALRVIINNYRGFKSPGVTP